MKNLLVSNSMKTQKPKFKPLEDICKKQCPIHDLDYFYVCCNPKCVDSDKYLLCPSCIYAHSDQENLFEFPSDGAQIADGCKPLSLHYVFSNSLMKEFYQCRSKAELKSVKYKEMRVAMLKEVEKTYEKVTKTILTALQESQKKVKEQILANLPHTSQMDKFRLELTDPSDVNSIDDIKRHVKNFGENLKKFQEIRRIDVFNVSDDMAMTEIENFKEKLSVMNEMIEEALDQIKELNRIPIEPNFSPFELYSKNLRASLSSKEIHLLEDFRSIETSHQINKLLFLGDNTIATASDDETIKICSWNLKAIKEIKTLRGHRKLVLNMIKLQNGRLCSAGEDKTIRVWNIEEGTCEKILASSSTPSGYSCYSGEVKGLLELANNILVGGGVDDIRFWDLKISNPQKSCIKVLSNPGRCKVIIPINDDHIACGSGSNINIFKLDGSDLPVMTLAGDNEDVENNDDGDDDDDNDNDEIEDLLFHHGSLSLISCCRNFIKIWNISDGACVRTVSENTEYKQMVFFKETVIATVTSSSIEFWNIETGQHFRELATNDTLGIAMRKGELISWGCYQSLQILY